MEQAFRIPLVYWARYIGVFIVGGIAVIVGIQGFSEVIGISYLLAFFAIFVLLLFAFLVAIFLTRRSAGSWSGLYFFLGHAALAMIGFGIIPLALYENVFADRSGFFLFSPTGIASLLVASGTIFVCYLVFVFLSRKLFERWFCKQFLRESVPIVPRSTFFVIGSVVLFIIGWLFVIFGDPLFIFGIALTPFMRFVFLALSGQFMFPGIMFAILFFASYILMLCSSIARGENKKNQALFYSFILLSKIFVGIHLTLWVFYMKALGIAFQVGSWNPFPFF